MDRINRYKNHGRIECKCDYLDHESHTIQGLAYTPSQMARMAERGMPVNNLNNQSAYFDGSPNASYHVGDERQRGVEVAELWEKHQVLREKARTAARSKKSNSKS